MSAGQGLVAAAALGVLMTSFSAWLWLQGAREAEDEVAGWLETRGLAHLRRYPPFSRLRSLRELADVNLDSLPEPLLWSSSLSLLCEGVWLLQLEVWLTDEGVGELLSQLVEAGHTSRESLLALSPLQVDELAGQLSPHELAQTFRRRLLHSITTVSSSSSVSSTSALGVAVYLFLSLILITLFLCLCCVLILSSSEGRDTPLATNSSLHHQLRRPETDGGEEDGEEDDVFRRVGDLWGGALSPDQCRLEWSHEDNVTVGTPSVATLHLARRNFAPYEVQRSDVLRVTVRHTATGNVIPHTMEPAPPTNQSRLRLSFTARLAGAYSVHVRLNGRSLAGTPVNRHFTPAGPWTIPLLSVFKDCLKSLLKPRQHQQDRSSRPHRGSATSPDGHGGGAKMAVCDLERCRLDWNQQDGAAVGGASVATLHLVSRDSTPYQLKPSDTLTVTVTHTATRNTIAHVVEPAPPTNQSRLRLSFTARLAGAYSVNVSLNGRSLAGTPVNRHFTPGAVDPAKTVFQKQPQWLVLTAGFYHSMTVVPRDCFGNFAIIEQEHLTVHIRKGGPAGDLINPECVVERVPNTSHFELLLKVEVPGHFIGTVLYKGQKIGPPQFTIISLSPTEAAAVDRNLHKRNLNLYYEATVTNTDTDTKHKKVYCYLYPKQFQVKEFYLIIFPYRLYTCKVCPSTSIILHEEKGVFSVDDGYQPPITLRSRQRELIAATFYRHLLRNIGGSEQFQDKRKFFQTELRSRHAKLSRGEKHLHIDRFNILASAMLETKNFSAQDWHKAFTVTFIGEEALDWGGVSREFYHILCTQCFNCSNGMFRRFKDDPQALVHPNPHHPPTITPHHYHFAGRLVGKCLLESALGTSQLVCARFTRSFLAQLIGLRMNYKYFESDDPDLYTSKVQYIRDNDVTDLELVFAEEEFGEDGTVKVVPLVEHGENRPVTEQNKTQYLNLLSQHRLASQCKTQVELFSKGLNELVPDNLLSIFDEHELELLMCGTETVSYEDLKRHAVVSAATANPTFQRVVSWFWLVVSGFTHEEMARLLQFVTGSSQLPPGGFKDLSPKFQITSAPTHGRLPSAHTCFNQLCLPEYDSCEQFQTALMLALNEGAEGFGFL